MPCSPLLGRSARGAACRQAAYQLQQKRCQLGTAGAGSPCQAARTGRRGRTRAVPCDSQMRGGCCSAGPFVPGAGQPTEGPKCQCAHLDGDFQITFFFSAGSSCLLYAFLWRAPRKVPLQQPQQKELSPTDTPSAVPSSSVPVDQRDDRSKELFIETRRHPLHALHACHLRPWHRQREEQAKPYHLFPAEFSPHGAEPVAGIPSLTGQDNPHGAQPLPARDGIAPVTQAVWIHLPAFSSSSDSCLPYI